MTDWNKLSASWLNEAPAARCNRCGRSTWDASDVDQEDRMTQPDGNPCGGRFRADDANPSRTPGGSA